MDYYDFLDHLFPGDDLDEFVENATQLHPDLQGMLAQVSECSGVKYDWLVNAAGLVTRGLAGAQCLWFLHGVEGDLEISQPTSSSSGIPTPRELGSNSLYGELVELMEQRRRQVFRKAYKKDADEPSPVVEIVMDWFTGVAEENIFSSEKTKTRKVKLGRWLRKQGASKELMHTFETRGPDKWHWRISAHPIDVLTMSHNRPWVSCMRPGGVYEFGPLTDMAAGAAVLFFYRPKADQPCGRMILRPAVENFEMSILGGQTVYGIGPDIKYTPLTKIIEEASGVEMPIYYERLCFRGERGQALTRNIYSDVDRHQCNQSQEDYDLAYERLSSAPWPEPRLTDEEFYPTAVLYAEELPIEVKRSGTYWPAVATDVSNNLWNNIKTREFTYILDWLDADVLTSHIFDEMTYMDITDEIPYTDLYHQIKENIQGEIIAMMDSQPSHILLFSFNFGIGYHFDEHSGKENKAFDELAEEESKTLLNTTFHYTFDPTEAWLLSPSSKQEEPLYSILAAGGTTRVVSTVNGSRRRLFFPVDGRPVEVKQIIVYPDAYYEELQHLPDVAIGHIIIPPGEYDWNDYL